MYARRGRNMKGETNTNDLVCICQLICKEKWISNRKINGNITTVPTFPPTFTGEELSSFLLFLFHQLDRKSPFDYKL